MKHLPQSFPSLFVVAVLAVAGSAGCQMQGARNRTPPPAAGAPPPPPPAQPPATLPSAGGGADINAGKQIATSGAPNGVAACASCHGAQGEGNPASGFPRIAGQPRDYLARQLSNYANASRNNPIMTPIAKALTPQQIDAVSAYYAALEAPAAAPPPANAATAPMQRGQVLANIGDEKIAVQACANCHGPGGAGQPPQYPYLASQIGPYLVTQLNDWKSGARKTDTSQQMQTIAKRLSDSDIAAVAAYFAAQPAPPSAVLRANVPAGSTARPAVPPARDAGTAGRGGAGQGPVPQQGVSGGATGAEPGTTEKTRP